VTVSLHGVETINNEVDSHRALPDPDRAIRILAQRNDRRLQDQLRQATVLGARSSSSDENFGKNFRSSRDKVIRSNYTHNTP
jgi:hypothetical protein